MTKPTAGKTCESLCAPEVGKSDGRRAFDDLGPLCDGLSGRSGVVAHLATRNGRDVQKMMAMSVLPGASIHLIQRSPSYVFQIGYSQFAVDRHLASMIFVRWNIAHPTIRRATV